MLTDVEKKKQNYTKNYYREALQQKCFITQKSGKVFETSAFSDWSASLFDFESSTKTN